SSSAPTRPRFARRSDSAVNPETSTKTSDPSISRQVRGGSSRIQSTARPGRYGVSETSPSRGALSWPTVNDVSPLRIPRPLDRREPTPRRVPASAGRADGSAYASGFPAKIGPGPMLRYILRRVAYSIPVLVLATMLIFVLVREFGADPARARCLHSRDVHCYPNAKHELGLDKSLPTQYVDFMGDFLQGKWGTSQRTDQSVAESIRNALGDTSQLALWGVLFSGAIAVTVGVYSANKPYSPGDYLFSGLAFAGIAMPTFWFGLLCIQFFTYDLQQWVGAAQPIFYSIPNPVSSGIVDYAREFTLPVLVLSVQ